MYHNFATMSHRVTWFAPKCAEINC